MQNYDTAYKRVVSDKVFLANIVELVNDIEPVIGGNYYSPSYWYWTRDAYAGTAHTMRTVRTGGSMGTSSANAVGGYVRAALFLESGSLKSGEGTSAIPYIIE